MLCVYIYKQYTCMYDTHKNVRVNSMNNYEYTKVNTKYEYIYIIAIYVNTYIYI